MKLIASISVLFLLLGNSLNAQNTQTENRPLTGTWKCVAHGGENGDLPFTLHLTQSGESLSGWISAPQGSTDITSASFESDHLKIEIDTDEDNYTLAATLKGNQLTGTWKRNVEKKGAWEGKKSSESAE
jgi:hypothetical protein